MDDFSAFVVYYKPEQMISSLGAKIWVLQTTKMPLIKSGVARPARLPLTPCLGRAAVGLLSSRSQTSLESNEKKHNFLGSVTVSVFADFTVSVAQNTVYGVLRLSS